MQVEPVIENPVEPEQSEPVSGQSESDSQLNAELLAVLEPEQLPVVEEDKKEVVPEEPREVLETLKDNGYGRFDIYKTTHGWWSDVGKVKDLIEGFKRGGTIISACQRAGISRDQYYYFTDVHPEFSYIIELCENVMPNMLDDIFFEELEKKNLTFAMWFASQRDKRFGRNNKPEDGGGKVDNRKNITNNIVVEANDTRRKTIVSKIIAAVEGENDGSGVPGDETGSDRQVEVETQ